MTNPHNENIFKKAIQLHQQNKFKESTKQSNSNHDEVPDCVQQ